jgi:hypothetical protein
MYQRQIPIIALSIVAGIVSVEYFINFDPLTTLKDELSLWTSNITNLVFIFGVLTLLLSHTRRIQRPDQPRNFRRSVVFMGIFAFFIILGLAMPKGINDPDFVYVYNNLVGAAGIGIGGTSFIYSFPATLRLFRRVRTFEALVFVGVGIMFFFGRTTSAVAMFPPFLDIMTWFQAVPGKAAMRGAYMAAAVGVVIVCIRAILGKEPGLVEAEEIKV